MRISPQSHKTEKVIEIFSKVMAGELDSSTGNTLLEKMMPTGPCDGYWHGDAGMVQLARTAAEQII